MLFNLPLDILSRISTKLSMRDILNLAQLCKAGNTLLKNNDFWEKYFTSLQLPTGIKQEPYWNLLTPEKKQKFSFFYFKNNKQKTYFENNLSMLQVLLYLGDLKLIQTYCQQHQIKYDKRLLDNTVEWGQLSFIQYLVTHHDLQLTLEHLYKLACRDDISLIHYSLEQTHFMCLSINSKVSFWVIAFQGCSPKTLTWLIDNNYITHEARDTFYTYVARKVKESTFICLVEKGILPIDEKLQTLCQAREWAIPQSSSVAQQNKIK